MSTIDCKFVSHSKETKNALARAIQKACIAIEQDAISFAREELQNTVYSQNDITWKLTGNLRDSTYI